MCTACSSGLLMRENCTHLFFFASHSKRPRSKPYFFFPLHPPASSCVVHMFIFEWGHPWITSSQILNDWSSFRYVIWRNVLCPTPFCERRTWNPFGRILSQFFYAVVGPCCCCSKRLTARRSRRVRLPAASSEARSQTSPMSYYIQDQRLNELNVSTSVIEQL